MLRFINLAVSYDKVFFEILLNELGFMSSFESKAAENGIVRNESVCEGTMRICSIRKKHVESTGADAQEQAHSSG
jgi:hypothetical protein